MSTVCSFNPFTPKSDFIDFTLSVKCQMILLVKGIPLGSERVKKIEG